MEKIKQDTAKTEQYRQLDGEDRLHTSGRYADDSNDKYLLQSNTILTEHPLMRIASLLRQYLHHTSVLGD